VDVFLSYKRDIGYAAMLVGYLPTWQRNSDFAFGRFADFSLMKLCLLFISTVVPILHLQKPTSVHTPPPFDETSLMDGP